LRLFPGAELIPFADFAAAYRACETGEADVAVLPFENSSEGEVSSVTDLMFNGSLYVNQVIEVEAEQNLLGLPGADILICQTVRRGSCRQRVRVRLICPALFDRRGRRGRAAFLSQRQLFYQRVRKGGHEDRAYKNAYHKQRQDHQKPGENRPVFFAVGCLPVGGSAPFGAGSLRRPRSLRPGHRHGRCAEA
jgi:hypothetical protein